MFRVFETSLPRELPIVHEITTVLREWHHLWKELYLVSLSIPVIYSDYFFIQCRVQRKWFHNILLQLTAELTRLI